MRFISFIINQSQQHIIYPRFSVYCHWMKNGDNHLFHLNGLQNSSLRLLEGLSQTYWHSSMPIFLLRYSKHLPNRWPAKTQAASLPCNVPKKTLMNCWTNSAISFIVYDKVQLMKNCLMLCPVSRR